MIKPSERCRLCDWLNCDARRFEFGNPPLKFGDAGMTFPAEDNSATAYADASSQDLVQLRKFHENMGERLRKFVQAP
jgi:hypothetical protein